MIIYGRCCWCFGLMFMCGVSMYIECLVYFFCCGWWYIVVMNVVIDIFVLCSEYVWFSIVCSWVMVFVFWMLLMLFYGLVGGLFLFSEGCFLVWLCVFGWNVMDFYLWMLFMLLIGWFGCVMVMGGWKCLLVVYVLVSLVIMLG